MAGVQHFLFVLPKEREKKEECETSSWQKRINIILSWLTFFAVRQKYSRLCSHQPWGTFCHRRWWSVESLNQNFSPISCIFGALLVKKFQPLLVLLEPSVFMGYRDLAALCRCLLRLGEPLLHLSCILFEEGLVEVLLCLDMSQLGLKILECWDGLSESESIIFSVYTKKMPARKAVLLEETMDFYPDFTPTFRRFVLSLPAYFWKVYGEMPSECANLKRLSGFLWASFIAGTFPSHYLMALSRSSVLFFDQFFCVVVISFGGYAQQPGA